MASVGSFSLDLSQRWVPEEVRVFGQGAMAAEEQLATEGATEFSLGLLGPYAVVDLRGAN